MTRFLTVCLALILLTGCAQKLPPHVWMPIDRVQGVDLFWWRDTHICQVRVVFENGNGTAGTWTYRIDRVDEAACLAWAKADGWPVPKEAKP